MAFTNSSSYDSHTNGISPETPAAFCLRQSASTRKRFASHSDAPSGSARSSALRSSDESSSDDLASYVNRLTRAPLLSAQEETRLALRIRQGDRKAKLRMIEANMRLVVSIARCYSSSGLPLEDLIQEGSIGLMTATERFDATRGYRFSTYATQWIRQAIGRAIDNKAKSIRVPAHVTEALRKLEKARAEYHRQYGVEPNSEQLAQRMGVTAQKLDGLIQASQDPISLDMPVGDDDNTTLGNLLLDKTSLDPQEFLFHAEMLSQLERILRCLDEREQLIMRVRFGFDDDEHRVLKNIGERLGISRERVRQLESQAIRKLRCAARKNFLREYL